MNTTNKSQVLLKAGDRVITSKGKIGEVLENQKIIFGYQESDLFTINKSFENWEQVDKYIFCPSESYIITVPKVRLGKKEFLIASEHLTKLENLFPVKVVYSTDPTGLDLDQEAVIYLPKDFCLYCCYDNKHEKSSSLVNRIRPYIEALTGERYYISILKIYAL